MRERQVPTGIGMRTVRVQTQAEPDASAPTPQRQEELRALRQANLTAGKAPYAGVRVKSIGELRWILAEHGWTGEYDEFQVKYSGLSPEVPTEPADLREIDLAGVNLTGMHLRRANLSRARLVSANLTGADLVDVNVSNSELGFAILDKAILNAAVFQGAHLRGASLQGADLSYTNLRGARLVSADLRGAVLRGAHLDSETVLANIKVDDQTELRDVVWEGAQLAQVDWSQVSVLGDEWLVRRRVTRDGKPLTREQTLFGYQAAVRANRQLATALRANGLNEHADRFAYRAQLLQTRVLLLQGKVGRWLFSRFLDGLADYGYRPGRSLIAYFVAIVGFGIVYFLLGQSVGPHLSPLGAFIFSMTSFHGRGFFPGGIGLNDPITALAALEAFVGLVIEVSFIATFTQRFFAR